MEAVNVSGLKNNPSEALRMAHRHVGVVMNRDRPDALMVGIEATGVHAGGAVRGLRVAPGHRRGAAGRNVSAVATRADRGQSGVLVITAMATGKFEKYGVTT